MVLGNLSSASRLGGLFRGDNVSVVERSARALRYMVQKLREKRVTLQRWANWVYHSIDRAVGYRVSVGGGDDGSVAGWYNVGMPGRARA